MSPSSHRPEGLERRQLERLEEHVQRGHLIAPEHLLQLAYAHLEDIQGLRGCSGDARLDLEFGLAEAICHVLDRVVSEWEAFSPVEQSWLRGAMCYFSRSDDALHDERPGGFRDDAEVLNACLRYVRREAWMLSLSDDAS